MKKYGELHLLLINGKEITYENVTHFNLIDNQYFIWIYRKPCINISRKMIHNFYYAYTPY